MPVLNYHKDDPALPDMSKPQKCDGCGCVEVGNQMYFSYYTKDQIGVICCPCYRKTYGGTAPVAKRNSRKSSTSSSHKVCGGSR